MNLIRGIVKAIALVGGALVTFVSFLALAGEVTGNGWAQLGLALVAVIGVPLVLVEIVLSQVAEEKQGGVTTDVLALVYLGFALAYVGVGHTIARPMLQAQGNRLEVAGMHRVAKASWFLAGGRGATPEVAPEVATVVVPAPTAKPEAKPEAAPALRPGDGKERTPAQVFAEFAPSVVTISVKGPRGEGGGTGFVLDSAGTIATNHHVIDEATEIQVKLMDGTFATEVEILVDNEPHDLALLRVKTPKPVAPVVLGDSDKVTVGERLVSIGNPLGLEHTLTDGLCSARRVMAGRKMIQMSTPVSPGNSGGPLFNSRGEVIGVSTAVYNGGSLLAQNLNLAMPSNDLRALIAAEYPDRHAVGASSSTGSGRW